jgi:hypothetical protein
MRIAHEILSDTRNRADVPSDLRRRAGATLRHFPKPVEVTRMARLPALTWWLEAEPTENREPSAACPRSIEKRRPSAWTVTSQLSEGSEVASTLVTICHAFDKREARSAFAEIFGSGMARRATIVPGVVINDVTRQVVTPHAAATMQRLAESGLAFRFLGRLDYREREL